MNEGCFLNKKGGSRKIVRDLDLRRNVLSVGLVELLDM